MEKRRLLTKSDFDGVLASALLKSAGIVNEVVFVNSFDFESGQIDIKPEDITCNLSYSDTVSLAFNYGKEKEAENHITSMEEKSSASIIFKHYDEQFEDLDERRVENLLAAVEKANTADYTREEVLNPQGFDMLNFLLDSRTGIGRIRAFRISNYALMMKLVDILLYEDLYKILGMPDIAERVEYYRQSALEYEEMLEFTAREEGEVLILDLRNEPYIKPANRFVKYALYPKSEYSIQVMWGLRKMNTVFAVGKSIFTEDKSERLNVEEVLKKYGGIARKNSGSLQVASEESEEILKSLVEELNSLL